jgi:hypothetical protein
MTRKLLPYEHDLIAALGVSKEEYLQFLALQEQPDFGTSPTADFGVTAIVLTVVGILFQVGAALLAPRPSIPSISAPDQAGGQAQSRDERFSPRFGFNSTQELATYGDPVNLVYANRGSSAGANPNGGVRVAASLLWSAVRSYGSSQFIQMLLMLSGGAITAIDQNKSAFGQTPVRDLITENLWMYFNPAGIGFLQRQHELQDAEASDPTAYGKLTDNPYRIQPSTENTRTDGFSQAYSPTTSNTFGIYGVVPLNVEVYVRNSVGDIAIANLGITATGLTWTAGTNPQITVNQVLSLTFASTEENGGDSDVTREAKDARRSLISVFDSAGIFKLGTARFKVISISNTSIDEASVVVKLQCIEAGRGPSAIYAAANIETTTGSITAAEREEYNRLRPTALSLLNEDQRENITSAYELADSKEIFTASYVSKRETSPATSPKPPGDGWQYGFVYTNVALSYWFRTVSVLTGYTKKRDLSNAEAALLRRYGVLDDALNATGKQDDIFYTKALVRVAAAQYETLSSCHIVDFALKALVFKRISGRQQEYGSGRRAGYPVSDNGIKMRVAMFKVRYREVGQTQWVTIPAIFALRRAADNENFVFFKFNSGTTNPSNATNWAFELEPISDPVAETAVNNTFYYLENSGAAVTQSLTPYALRSGQATTPNIQFVGRVISAANGNFPPYNNNPTGINEWDLFNYSADTQIQFSFDNGPEFAITAVTEQLAQPFTDYDQRNSRNVIIRRLYQNLALFGFNAYSGKTIQDLRSFSVFATQGRSVRRIRTSGVDEQNRSWGSTNYTYYPATPNGASSVAPDIFLDTVLDKEDGIGNYAVASGIDVRQLAITKRFCIRNKLFMDCVIASPRSWREFWVEVAPFNLLEFARIGGRETLVPAVPYDATTGAITRTVNVSAIFNTGNILEDSYKEEFLDYGSNVQDMIATIIYTDVPTDAVFAKKRSVDIQRKDTLEADAIRQTFDLSAYVSNLDQAILFGKLICNTRRYIRQAIEFKTYPTSDPISPGAYIYVDIGQNSWDAIRTGVIATDGTLNTPLDNTVINGTYNFKLYRSDRGLVNLFNVQIANGRSDALRPYEGFLFVLGVEATSRRVFRVSEVQMDEEGETTVRATIYPCTTDGQSLLADFSDTAFTVRS